MGKIGIFDEDRTRWVEFDEDTEIRIRFVGKEELARIHRKAAKKARLSGADASEIQNRELGRVAVLGWRNVDDHDHPGLIVNDQPLEFTQENLDMLMKRSLEFSAFVNQQCVDSRAFLEAEEEEDAIKNG